MHTTRPPAAVLWDMDGTLINSEPYWFAAEYALVEEFGGRWNDDHAGALVGSALIDAGRYIREHGPVDLEPEAIVDGLVAIVAARLREAMPWQPGASELLSSVRATGIPCALVTMSYRSLLDPLLESLPADTFGAVVTGDEVTHGKPHPEPYETAARLLGVDPTDCVAIEDSEPGARSAVAAGCRVIVVPAHGTVAPGPGRTFVTSLLEVDVSALGRV